MKKKLASVFERKKAYDLLMSYKDLQFTQDGKSKLILRKQVEITARDKQIILNQIKATHEGIEAIETITELEVEMPEGLEYKKGEENSIDHGRFPDNIWGKVRSYIARSIRENGAVTDKNWFSKLEAKIDEESKEIILNAPSQFFSILDKRELSV